jgi:DNA replication and repair protein RecF
VYIEQIGITDFRNFVSAEIEPAPSGITLFQGDNGSGKTNLLEAVAYCATLKSFRGAPATSMVRLGAQQAVLRARAHREGRSLLVETELNLTGRDKVRVNRQPVRRADDLLGLVLVTIFSPDDIEVVKGGPQFRRQYLDDLLVVLHPRHNSASLELERVLKQRNALLRSAGGALRGSMVSTLDVWDSKLASVGEAIAEAREGLSVLLEKETDKAYQQLSGRQGGVAGAYDDGGGDDAGGVRLCYQRSWRGPLLAALNEARAEDVRRGVTGVGPQRDEMYLSIVGLAARTQASQGEQRSLALSLRLGGHSLVSDRQGSSPVLLLDDVFSELDPRRSAALASCLPDGQALLTTAGPVPSGLPVAHWARVHDGVVERGGPQP